MDSFESIVAALRKASGKSFGFAAAEGDKKAPIVIVAHKSKAGSALVSTVKKSGKLLAHGMITINDAGQTEFSCSYWAAGFKETTLKPYFSKIKEKPSIKLAAENVDGADGADSGEVAANAVDEMQDAEDEIEDDGGEIVIWSRSFAASLKDAVPKATLDQIGNADKPYTMTVPTLFMRTLRKRNAAPFAQKMIDAVNKEFDPKMAEIAHLLQNPTPTNIAAIPPLIEAFDVDAEAVAEKFWDAFCKRYEVTKGLKKKKFIATAMPVVGGAAAVGGIATSMGNPVTLAPAAISLLRAVAAGAETYRVYYNDLADAAKQAEATGTRLNKAFLEAKEEAETKQDISAGDKAGEVGRALVNALTGTGFAGSLNSLSSDLPTLEARRAKAERGLDDVLGSLNPLIDHVARLDTQVKDSIQKGIANSDSWSAQTVQELTRMKKEIDAIRPKITAGLNDIAAENKKLTEIEAQLKRGMTVVEKLGAAQNNPAIAIDKFQQVVTVAVNASLFAVNAGIGLSTSGDALGFLITGAGATADGWDSLEVVRNAG
ncbi:hypothetical protein [uncultured Tateyamaria sp.]|uniref:hypothetical protein n=1 Tax=uncultured Tateyamaria sp. TaxID=455651 RepID=UPI00260B05D3|nr:hypothetical protein [uncultured Tateyamaria sp.]